MGYAGKLHMHASSTDLKERLVRAVAEGQPMRAAARRFGVAGTTVTRAVVQPRETGSLERRPIRGCPRRRGPELAARLRARLEAAPDATGLEHCAWWAEQYGQEVREATLWRAIRRRGGTHQKKSWQPVSATRRHAPHGGKRSPRSPHNRSSSSTRAAPTRPGRGSPAGHPRSAGDRIGAAPHGKKTTCVAAVTPDGRHVPCALADRGRDGDGALRVVPRRAAGADAPTGTGGGARSSECSQSRQQSSGPGGRGLRAALPAPAFPGLHPDRAGVLHAPSAPARPGRSHP
jgi:transposase